MATGLFVAKGKKEREREKKKESVPQLLLARIETLTSFTID
jgi:hypothetical protein